MAYSDEVLADTPVAYWRFEESSGSTLADSSGNGYGLSGSGGTASAAIGKAPLLTSGSTYAIEVTDAAGPNFFVTDSTAIPETGQWTVETWFKSTSGWGTGDTFFNRDGWLWLFVNSNGTINARNLAGGSTNALTPQAWNDGQVHHLVAVQRATTLEVWVDGVMRVSVARTASADNPSPTNNIQIAGFTGTSTRRINSALDEFAIYSHALSATRIAAHYTAGTSAAGTTGTLAANLPSPTGALSGSVAAGPVSGSLAATSPATSAALTGTVLNPVTGSLAATSPATSAALTGTVPPPPVGDYPTEVLADAPLVWWRLHETSGTTLVDSSGNTRDGVWNGTPGFGAAAVLPVGGSSVTFSSDDYGRTVADHEAWMNTTTAMSVEAWGVFSSSTGASSKRTLGGRWEGNDQWVLYLYDNVPTFYIVVGSSTYAFLEAPSAIPLNTPVHLAATYDGANMRIYVNGSQVASKAQTGTLRATSLDPVAVGSDSWGVFNMKSGRMAEFAYYGTALSPTRVQAHYQAGTTITEVTGTLAASIPAIEAFLRDPLGEVTGTLDATWDGLVAALTGYADVQPVDRTIANQGRTRLGTSYATVEYSPASPPAAVHPAPIRVMAQQLPEPFLVDGRPT